MRARDVSRAGAVLRCPCHSARSAVSAFAYAAELVRSTESCAAVGALPAACQRIAAAAAKIAPARLTKPQEAHKVSFLLVILYKVSAIDKKFR